MTGSAYLTPITPDPPNPEAVEAIYAVWPPRTYPGGETVYLLVTSCPQVQDTCILPVDGEGKVGDYALLGCVPGIDHELALRSIDYEPERVTHART